MNEQQRERALGAGVVGGLAVAILVASQAIGTGEPALFIPQAHGESFFHAGVAEENVALPGVVWMALPACHDGDLGGDPPEVTDVRLVGAQGLEVEKVFVDALPDVQSEKARSIEGGSGIGWPHSDDGAYAFGSHVIPSCGEYGGGQLEAAQRIHVVMQAQDLGPERIPQFDALEVDWSSGDSDSTTRVSVSMAYCPEGAAMNDCHAIVEAGKERRDALDKAWAEGQDAPDFQWTHGEMDDVANLPDIRQNKS
ncbi:hypothetical protein [Kytococcus sedentarius]|uniref:hypothetical protein n=1 Tax=Kytococcus sedentarius TaxID=1276 RepID=UPI0035BBC918